MQNYLNIRLSNVMYKLDYCLQQYDETCDEWWKNKTGVVLGEAMAIMAMRDK